MKAIKKSITLLMSFALILSSFVFVSAEDTYTASIKVGTGGKVNEKTGEFTEQMTSGTPYTLSFVADDGYVLDKVLVNGQEEADFSALYGTASGSSTLTNPEDDYSFEFTFKQSTSTGNDNPSSDNPSTDNPSTDTPSSNTDWTINVAVEGPGTAMIMGSGLTTMTYNAETSDEDKSVMFVGEEADIVVKSFIVNGVEDTTQKGKNGGTFIPTSGNTNIKIVFEKASSGSEDTTSYTVTTSAGEHGTITPSFTYVANGQDQKVIINADSGYYIATVKINGVDKTLEDNVGIGQTQGSYSFKEGNQTIDVTFSTTEIAYDDAGSFTMEADKSTVAKGDEVTVTYTFYPRNTSVESTAEVAIGDGFEFISTDKGEFKDGVIKYTIPANTESATMVAKVKYIGSTNDSKLTITLKNDGKEVSNYQYVIGEADVNTDGNGNNSGNTTEEKIDLTGGTLGFTVDGDFYAYTAPSGENDAYFESMTILNATPDSAVKVAIQKDDQIYEAGNMSVTGLTDKKDSFTGQELYDAGNKVSTKGLEAYHCFTLGAEFDPAKYTVPAELQPSGMQALISLEDDEEIIDEPVVTTDEDIENESTTNNNNTKDTKKVENKKDTVKTGDNSNIILYSSITLLSAMLLTLLSIKRKRVLNR